MKTTVFLIYNYFLGHKQYIGSKPDRSFVSPFHHTVLNDEVFAELESPREGAKAFIFTYVFD